MCSSTVQLLWSAQYRPANRKQSTQSRNLATLLYCHSLGRNGEICVVKHICPLESHCSAGLGLTLQASTNDKQYIERMVEKGITEMQSLDGGEPKHGVDIMEIHSGTVELPSAKHRISS